MKNIFIVLLVFVVLLLSSIAYATATSETGNKRAKPVVLYGTTSGGSLKPILTDADGIVQVS